MKRDFLKGLDMGEGARLQDNVIDAIMAEHGKTKQQQDQTIQSLQSQLGEANKKLEGYDPDWKAKADAAEEKLKAQQFDFALEREVAAAKPRNAKAVMALLDREKLTFAGGEVVGLEKQIAALKAGEDTAFLFQSEQKPPHKTGMSHQGGSDVGGEDKKSEANEALRAVFASANKNHYFGQIIWLR